MDNNEKLEKKIDTMFDHLPTNTDEIIKLVNKLEGTHGDRYLLAVLVMKLSELTKDVSQMRDRIQDLENINERLGESFRNRNEYGGGY